MEPETNEDFCQQLQVRLLACAVDFQDVEIQAKRQLAKTQLAEWIEKNRPRPVDSIVDSILEVLKLNSGVQHWLVREAIIEQLEQMSRSCPQKAGEIILAVLDACADDVSNVCKIARLASQRIFANLLARTEVEKGIKAVLQACANSDSRVQEAAAYLLSDCLVLAPHRCQDIVDHWFRICANQYFTHRWKCPQRLVACNMWLATPPDMVIVSLLKCEDEDVQIRAFAVRWVVKCAGACHDLIHDIVDVVLTKCRCEVPYVKEEAFRHLGELIEACPARANDIIVVLVHCARRDRLVYEAALGQAMSAVRACPERANSVLALVFLAWEIDDSDVKIQAVDQMVKMVEVCPRTHDPIVSQILDLVRFADERTRIAVIKQLPQLSKSCPMYAECLADVLFWKCCTSDLYELRPSRREAVEPEFFRMELEEIIRIHSQPSSSEWQDPRGSPVRQAAIHQLPRFMEMCPRMAGRAFELLLVLSDSKDELVRLVAKRRLDEACRHN